jgi:hypothetical protein
LAAGLWSFVSLIDALGRPPGSGQGQRPPAHAPGRTTILSCAGTKG